MTHIDLKALMTAEDDVLEGKGVAKIIGDGDAGDTFLATI